MSNTIKVGDKIRIKTGLLSYGEAMCARDCNTGSIFVVKELGEFEGDSTVTFTDDGGDEVEIFLKSVELA